MSRNTRSIFALAGVALAPLALVAARPTLAQEYNITGIGTLPGYAYGWVWQQTINSSGAVAAYANNGDAPGTSAAPGMPDPNAYYGDASYLWKNGTLTPLTGLPTATDTIAFSLNDNGQVVGRSTPAGQANQPVQWNNGVIQQLPTLAGDNKGGALNINNAGQAVGYSANTNTGVRTAVTWNNGVVSQLTPLPGGAFSEALGINAQGQIAGWAGSAAGLEHITLWSGGTATDLGTLGGSWGDGYAINNSGEIVGTSATATNPNGEAFLYANGQLTDLGLVAGDYYSVALDINDSDQAVGFSTSDPNGILPTHALLWENGQMINLQNEIAAGSGWQLLAASGINASGEIVGTGLYDGQFTNFVLAPVPEPGAYALFASLGLTALACLRRRRTR